jgi:outer membrane protein TolC
MKTTYRATARFVACLLASLVLFVPCLAAAQQTVTLEEAVQLALDRSPQMLQQEQALENAALAERSAWGAFLPSVSASSSGSLRSANATCMSASVRSSSTKRLPPRKRSTRPETPAE